MIGPLCCAHPGAFISLSRQRNEAKKALYSCLQAPFRRPAGTLRAVPILRAVRRPLPGPAHWLGVHASPLRALSKNRPRARRRRGGACTSYLIASCIELMAQTKRLAPGPLSKPITVSLIRPEGDRHGRRSWSSRQGCRVGQPRLAVIAPQVRTRRAVSQGSPGIAKGMATHPLSPPGRGGIKTSSSAENEL